MNSISNSRKKNFINVEAEQLDSDIHCNPYAVEKVLAVRTALETNDFSAARKLVSELQCLDLLFKTLQRDRKDLLKRNQILEKKVFKYQSEMQTIKRQLSSNTWDTLLESNKHETMTECVIEINPSINNYEVERQTKDLQTIEVSLQDSIREAVNASENGKINNPVSLLLECAETVQLALSEFNALAEYTLELENILFGHEIKN